MEEWQITLLGILGGWVLSFTALVIGILNRRYEKNKTVAETENTTSETILNLQKAVQQAQDRAYKTEQRFTEFEKNLESKDLIIKARDMQIENLMVELRERDKTIADLKDWAERLVHQVYSLGGLPVSFKIEPPALQEANKK